jgi:LAS superfamily LD-carboxypeptidase LdcB
VSRTPLTPEELTGRTRRHVVQDHGLRIVATQDATSAFLNLRGAAAADGFDLRAVSTFRDFDTQVRIWNQKFMGQRPLYDKKGVVLSFTDLSLQERVHAILSWSALPGASRHHWGTEFDVFDGNYAEPSQVQLLPTEFEPGGKFHALHRWLDENLERHDFFRPYDVDRGGIFPEPWHLSYRPLSDDCLRLLTVDVIKDALMVAEIEGKDSILTLLPEIYRKYIINIAGPRVLEPGVST